MALPEYKETRQEIEKFDAPIVIGDQEASYAHVVYEDVFSTDDDSLISSRIIQGPTPLWGKTKANLIAIYSNPNSKLPVKDTEDYARFVNQLENEES